MDWIYPTTYNGFSIGDRIACGSGKTAWTITKIWVHPSNSDIWCLAVDSGKKRTVFTARNNPRKI